LSANLFIPPQLSCPKHGQHQNPWLTFSINSSSGGGVHNDTKVCGLCIIELLRGLGFEITEPETLKETEWILDEVPEVKR